MLSNIKNYFLKPIITNIVLNIFMFCVLTKESQNLDKSLLDFIFSPCKCLCGVPNRDSRIFGGEPLLGHEFPWTTLIIIKGETSIPGTIINNKYVVTAASRIHGLSPYDIKVTVGQFDRCFSEISANNMSVEKIVLHPDFSPETKAHDIALIKLNSPLNFDRKISPICLSTPSTKYLGQVATVYGWPEEEHKENTETLSAPSCRPKKLGLPVLGPRECLSYSGESHNLDGNHSNQGCIGVIGSLSPVEEKDTGGPVMFRTYGGKYELVGILTHNDENDRKFGLAFYTNINEHLAWITKITRDACYCFKS